LQRKIIEIRYGENRDGICSKLSSSSVFAGISHEHFFTTRIYEDKEPQVGDSRTFSDDNHS